jgi:hypothetical protein
MIRPDWHVRTLGRHVRRAPERGLINHIEVVGDYLYVANSRDGLVVVRVDAE